MDSNQEPNETKISSPKNKTSLTVDLRLVVAILTVIIIAMLLAWKPWSVATADAKNRTVTVTGEATIHAVPDEYIFRPSYEVKNADKTVGLEEITKKSKEIIKKLKGLGVADSKIKSDANGYNYSYYYDDTRDQNTYTLNLTVTVDDKALAQKVQDYLVTTAPTGNVSPEAAFSQKLRKELENNARDAAAKDARAKAERTAKNIGFNVGKVKSISDSNNGSSPVLFRGGDLGIASGDTAEKQSLAVQPGENELPYAITVVYYVTD